MNLLSFLGIGNEQPPAINSLLQMISKRAERLDPRQLADTFVSLGGIEHTLLNPDNRVIFGRRGTGKTHVMSFVADAARKAGDVAFMIDLRTIGSNSYIYVDESVPVAERATRLLRDFLIALHDGLLDQLTAPRSGFDVKRLSPLVDQLGSAVKEVIVRDTVERRVTENGGSETKVGAEVSGKASGFWASLEGKASGEHTRSKEKAMEVADTGRPRLSVNIGNVHRTLNEIAQRLDRRTWILIDEWSSLPEILQPYIADFIKRVFFPNRLYSIHIAAIEQRSRFRDGYGAETVGIELGSDASADVNLDDHLVFENNPSRSVSFFKEMLFRHIVAINGGKTPPTKGSDELIRRAFTQEVTFRELVRACEGVPRDMINILQIAATRAQEEKISVPHIRDAAKDWYNRDKAAYVNTNGEADALLHWIIDRIIGGRKAKAFLVRSDVRNEILERLFDERILHIARKSYSTKEEPGVRYKVWKLDYGCYVDLINTSRAPTGFLVEGLDVSSDGAIPVPEDDLRAIRRAVLNLAEFEDQKRNGQHEAQSTD